MPQEKTETPNVVSRQTSNSQYRPSQKGLNPSVSSQRATLLSEHEAAIAGVEETAEVGSTFKILHWNIQMKPGATYWNLWSICLLQFFVMVVAGDYQTLETLLIQNKNYYNKTIQEATKIQIYEGVVSGIPQLVMMFTTGYAYDIFGVKWALFIGTFFSGASLMLYPLGAPHLWILYTGGCLFGIGLDIVAANTLIIDYVEVKSRGKALSFSFMGVCFGSVLSSLVLLKFTIKLDPLFSWAIMSGVMVVFSISMLLTASEPRDRFKKEDAGKPILRKIWDLTKGIGKAVKKNPNLLIGWIMSNLIEGPIMIFETYIFAWLEAFCPDDGSGPFSNFDDVYNYYEFTSALGSILAFFVLFFAGSVADKVNFKVFMPITLLLRAGVYYATFNITNPVAQSYLFWTAVPLCHVTFYVCEVGMKGYLLKLYPTEIRGMCIMAQHITGYVIGSAYPFLLQYFFEINARYVFLGASVIDLVTIVVLLGLFSIGFGKENLLEDKIDKEGEVNQENPESQQQVQGQPPAEHSAQTMI